jgi:hypothetical protein
MQTWKFQANPKIYDVARAVRSLREDTWLVRQHRNDIHPQDRVYLWECGPDAGILAVGEVLDDVTERDLLPESKPFVLDSIKLGGIKFRVLVRIARVCEPKLRRTSIMQHPQLSNLPILRQPQGTNFPVSPEQAAIIEELLGD